MSPLNFPESGEDDFEVVVRRHGVELANEQNVFRRRHVGVREIADHLQNGRPGPGLFLRHPLRDLLLVHAVVVVLSGQEKRGLRWTTLASEPPIQLN